jgi:hypothetical protein
MSAAAKSGATALLARQDQSRERRPRKQEWETKSGTMGSASARVGWPKSKIMETGSEPKNLIVKTGVNWCCARNYQTRKLEQEKEPRIREKYSQQLGLTSRQNSKKNRTLVQRPKWAGRRNCFGQITNQHGDDCSSTREEQRPWTQDVGIDAILQGNLILPAWSPGHSTGRKTENIGAGKTRSGLLHALARRRNRRTKIGRA